MKLSSSALPLVYLVCFFAITASFPSHVSAQVSNHYESALQDFNQDNIDEAFIHLKNALEENSRHLPSKLLMARVLFSKQLLADALIEFEESVVLGADLNLVQLNLAKLYLLLGENHRVLALDIDTLNIANQFEVLLTQASAAFGLGEDVLAESLYQNAIALAPNNPKGLQAFIVYYLFTDQVQRAKPMLRQLEALGEPDFKTLHIQSAFAKRDQNLERQVQLLERANQLQPNEPLIMRSLASAYVSVNQTSKAISVLEEIRTQTPDDPFTSILYAELVNSADPTLADEIFEQLNRNLDLIPSNMVSDRPELRYAQALAMYLNGSYEQALRDFEVYYSRNRSDLTAMSVLADIYIRLGQVTRAQHLLDDNLRQVESNVRLTLLLCDLYIQSGKDYNCELLKNKLAARLGETNPNVVLVNVKILSARDKHDEALDLFLEHFSNQTDRLFVYYRIELYRKNGMLTEALDTILERLKLAPDDKLVTLLHAEVLIGMRRLEDSEPVLLSILDDKTNPYNIEAKRNLAFVYVVAEKIDEAKPLIDELLIDFPQDPYLLMMHGEVLLANNVMDKAIDELLLAKNLIENNPRPSELLIDVYIKQGELERAMSELNGLVRTQFLNPRYIQQRANLHIKMGDFESAARDLNSLFGIWAEDKQRLLALSRQQVDINDLENAERSILTALKLDPSDIDSQIAQIRLHILKNNYKVAKKGIQTLIAQHPDNVLVRVTAGDVEMMQNNVVRAYVYYKSALREQPNFTIAAVKLYELAQAGVNMRATIDILQGLSSADNPNPLIENMLADIYMNVKEYDPALKYYMQVIKNDNYPNTSSVLNNIANIYITVKSDLVSAKEYADRAQQLAPDSIQSISTRGWLLAKSEEYESALPYLRQAFTLDSSAAQVRYHLAFTLHKLGRINEARQELKMALESEEDFFGKEQAFVLKATLDAM